VRAETFVHPTYLCQAAAKGRASQEYLRHESAAFWYYFKRSLVHCVICQVLVATRNVFWQRYGKRAGNMNPPLKPAKTVMEMATSLAKATAISSLRKIENLISIMEGWAAYIQHGKRTC
jgi:hypothetical protein